MDLDHPVVFVGVLVDLENATTQRVRLGGDRFSGRLARDTAGFLVGLGLEDLTRRGREDARCPWTDESPGGLVGRTFSLLRDPDRYVDRDDARIDEQRVRELLAAEGLDDAVFFEDDDGQPAAAEARASWAAASIGWDRPVSTRTPKASR
jgi:hypothetical protein